MGKPKVTRAKRVRRPDQHRDPDRQRDHPAVEHLEVAVHKVLETTEALIDDLATLAQHVKILDKATVAINHQLMRAILVVRDLLVVKGIVSVEEMHTAAQLAELDAMLERSEEGGNLDG